MLRLPISYEASKNIVFGLEHPFFDEDQNRQSSSWHENLVVLLNICIFIGLSAFFWKRAGAMGSLAKCQSELTLAWFIKIHELLEGGALYAEPMPELR